MNPQAREAEPASLTVPEIASSRPARYLRHSSHLSYKQRVLSLVFAALALPGIASMAPRIVFGQIGSDQKDEQMVDPDQFTEPMVAGVVTEARAEISAENPSEEEFPVSSEAILTAVISEPELATPDTRSCAPWPEEIAKILTMLPVVEGFVL